MNGLVAIVGRPNVGKSTLFNRLIESRQAIVEDQPGVTRDRNTGVATWNGKEFTVIDTGGYVPRSTEVYEAAIREQVEIALDEADAVIFAVDVKDGLTPDDEDILQIIRRKQKHHKVVLAVNKADNHKRDLLAGEFYGLGLAAVFPISAMAGTGTGELLDALAELLPDDKGELPDPGVPRLAIVGRPNVGKSSFVNALLGKSQHIVTPLAGTTRDSIATRYKAFGFDFYLVDTAGLRRKARVQDNVEFYANIRTLKALEECDIALLMISAESGMEAQDLAILHQVERLKKGLIILVNKWDLVNKQAATQAPGTAIDRKYIAEVEERLLPLAGVPILLISATEKLRLHKAMQTAQDVFAARNRRVPTRELNDIMLPYILQTPPASARGKLVRIKFVTQAEGRIPTFIFFANHPKLVQENYRRFLEGKIREHFGFQGWPINIFFREK